MIALYLAAYKKYKIEEAVALLKEKHQIMHNQRRASELTGKIKDVDLTKILNIGKWKLKPLPGNI